MNKTEILEEYKNQEQRLLAAKILDKLEFTKTKNKIQSTDFLNLTAALYADFIGDPITLK